MPHKLFGLGARLNTAAGPAQGVNFSGLEYVKPGIRFGQSTGVNINFTIVRLSDVQWTQQQGFTKNRLCMLWELLQPCLTGLSPAPNTTVLAGMRIAVAGDMVPQHMKYILDVLDHHANAGIKCLLDLHNYCRYQDFFYQGDGSVIGFAVPGNPLLPPYTTDGTQVHTRIMSLNSAAAPNLTISQQQFSDFWTKFITYVETGTGRTVKQHAGLAGYGLMNEPNAMPGVNGTTPNGSPEDLNIWNTFAQSAITAIRAVDASTPIYVAGNSFEIGWTANPGGSYAPGQNPMYPLTGNNLIYEGHFYLDHVSSGGVFDWTIEFAAGFCAGESNTVGARLTTGGTRANYMITYAGTGQKVAITEMGMPVNDLNWQTSAQTAADNLFAANIEYYAWAGGNHFPNHDFALCAVPNFKRPGLTMEPLICGILHKSAARSKYTIYADADKNFGAAGTVCTVTLYTRGYSPSGLVVNLAKTGAGTLSAANVTIPAGANKSVTFTYTTAGTEDATVTFSNQAQVPPVMHFYSMDPVTYQATDAVIAGRACLAKYKAREWLASNCYTDYMGGNLVGAGGVPRAVYNSGFGEDYFNADGMKIWITPSYDSANFAIPTLTLDGNGKTYVEFAGTNVWGFWSHKRYPNQEGANTENTCVNQTPFLNTDSFFQISSVAIPSQTLSGVVFATNNEQGSEKATLEINAGKASMVIRDGAYGAPTQTTDPAVMSVNTPHILTMTSAPGAQVLRMDGTQKGTSAANPAAAHFSSQEIGFIYDNYFPNTGWGGKWYASIAGKGAPTAGELFVMEQYLALLSGTTLTPPAGDYPAGVVALTAWYDPSKLTTLFQSSVGGGAVTAAGDIVGQMDNRVAGAASLVTPDTERFVIRNTTTIWYLDTGATWSQLAAGLGGATTAFYWAWGGKLTGGFNNTPWSDRSGPNNGYEITYDGGLDKFIFSVGTGAARTSVQSSGTMGGFTGPAFVLTCWDDGTNLNIQVNNGTIVQSAAHGAVSAGGGPFVGMLDAAKTNTNYANFYGMMWAKNSALSAPDKAGIKTWLGAKVGLTL